MKKKDRFKTGNKVYEIAGSWKGSIILSPSHDQDDHCLICTEGEIQELIQNG